MWLRRLATMVLGLVAACDAGDDTAAATSDMPTLALLDSVVLDERGDEYVTALGGFLVSPGGEYFVGDGFGGRVLRFAAHGGRLGIYGRPGRGPGELDTPSRLALAGDSLLVVADSRAGKLELYDLASRAHRRTIRFDGYVYGLHVRGDTIWVGAPSVQHRLGMARLTVGDTVATERWLPFPSTYADSSLLADRYAAIAFGVWGDTLLASYHGAPYWTLGTPDGRMRDTLVVPAVRRHGVPADLAARLQRIRSQQEQFSLSSWPVEPHRLPDGRVAMVHMHSHLSEALAVTMTGFVSIVTADLARACVDAPLAFSPDGMARVAWRGDTLLTAEQVVQGDAARVIVKRYRVDTAGCAWRPVWRGARPTDRVDDRPDEVPVPAEPRPGTPTRS
jgi:hypothetical protein